MEFPTFWSLHYRNLLKKENLYHERRLLTLPVANAEI